MSSLFSSFSKNKAGAGDGLKSSSASESVDMRFTIQPTPGESGFSQWVAAMKMVAQLPGGIPPEFRRRLWVTMAERHLTSRGIDWTNVEKSCFSEWSHPADAELGIQIVKDLHRTGCSLFCGEDGQENQALLKKVLLAYARWNKAVGYCQGFNMLAALLLQVTDRCESDALKLMIYLIEGLLPDSYFADSLRGLSVDMAVFRELLRSKLPSLSKHLDVLQNAAKDGSRSYEPPLTNVFTMQWFLTLFCNCLPQPTVLRVWDLIFLEGNEILLRTALAIWQVLAQRILVVRTADEFYCIMGALTRELLESNLIDANTLIKAIVTIGPLPELKSLRDHYLYNITPWGTAIPQPVNKQISLHPKNLDISALKKQYVKLKQRQRQAHVIFSSAISRQPSPSATPVAMNHLLVGKRSLGSAKRVGPPKGSIPPVRSRQVHPTTLHWKDAEKQDSSSSSSDTELCDDDVKSSSDEETSQLPKDNPTSSDIKDNIKELEPIADKSLLCPSPVNLKVISDSEDENEEFESFLADRVKCLKDIDSDVSVTSNTRRNSELALQIIQENSLILHRIMQCQSRFSPSPPLLIDSATVSTSASYLDLEENTENTEQQKMEEVSSWIESQPLDAELELPVFKYRSILEKSKSLDERYNSLFSSSVKEMFPPLGELHESKSETPIGSTVDDSLLSPEICSEPFVNTKTDSEDTLVDLKDNNKSSQLIQENLDLLKAYSAKEKSKKIMQENVELLESISSGDKSLTHINDTVITKADDQDSAISIDIIDNLINLGNEPSRPNSADDLDGCDIDYKLSLRVETRLSPSPSSLERPLKLCDDPVSPNKSPNKVFNPFPVSLNTRQSKEVPLKLGLYKK
ncbi:uncharacterized protein LOC126742110 isoform X2 [Anthonomus grandis grandis]|uniref:uncharacterized protein LOC126742110 isoform X2 n=1 Tax=Anthonomus grandis grandis TaxID=2921223 RepID=UPI0021659506|nr:uncharacterized protein LOC126742110 isoform X2 [Anthonomus grandis grandis]